MIITQPVGIGCRFAAISTLLLVMHGCGGQPVDTRSVATERSQPVGAASGDRVDRRSASSKTANSKTERAVAVALDQVGVPYRYGGNDRSGFDCSGLVQYSYARAGIGVPRTTGQLWQAAQPINRHDLRPGDLLFFNIEGKMAHVGLYVGDGHFVHAPSSGRAVSVANLRSGYYKNALIRGGRIN